MILEWSFKTRNLDKRKGSIMLPSSKPLFLFFRFLLLFLHSYFYCIQNKYIIRAKVYYLLLINEL